MDRQQRYKHEMLVRVRDFGTANMEVFPESSPGGEKFARVRAAVAAIDDHLKNRVLGRAGARGVKASTRAVVFGYMKTIAKAARRITRQERDVSPFRLPRRRTLTIEVATARAFLEEAEKRHDQFIGIGLPSTFISDFRELVNELSQAVDARLNSKTMRGQAQAGIASAVRLGLDIVRDLDVIVEIASRQDPVLAATWRSARRIEGLPPSSSTTRKTAVPMPAVPPVEQLAADPLVGTEPTNPRASSDGVVEGAALVDAPDAVLRRAS